MQHFANKYNFICLSHKPIAGHITLDELLAQPQLIQSIDVVLNLAGASIAAKRWSAKRKKELIASRVNTTKQLVDVFNSYGAQVYFISASAIGIYEPNSKYNENTINNENTIIDYHCYNNFSQQITKCWELAAAEYKGRLAITRFGVVLCGHGGALPQIIRQFSMGLGGKLGNGKQYFPWISIVDLLNALDWLIKNNMVGKLNLVAQQQITNRELCNSIAAIWKRPSWLNLPEFLIRILFGQMGQELLLNSICVEPLILLNKKFNFQYPTIESCLTNIKNS